MLSATLQEYLDRDDILKGVFEWIIEESPLMGALPFKKMVGNALKYNVELTLPTASWIARNQQLTENTGTFEQRTTDVYTLIHTGYTNKSAIKLNVTQDPEAVDIEKAVKAMAHEFEKSLIIGQTSVTSTVNQFKGLLRTVAELETASTKDLDAINNSQVIAGTTSSGAMTMEDMDELIDQINVAPVSTETQETLFGEETRTQSLVFDRARLVSTIRGRLGKDKRLFSLVSKSAETLERGGNVIDSSRSAEVSGVSIHAPV